MGELVKVNLIKPINLWKLFAGKAKKKSCDNKDQHGRPERSDSDFHAVMMYSVFCLLRKGNRKHYAFEDHFIGEVAGDGSGGNAEEGDAPSILHGAKGMVQRGGVTGHFQRHIDPFSAGDFEDGCGNGFRSVGVRVQEMIDPHFLGQPQPVVAHVSGDNRGGARRTCHGGGEETGRAAAGDEDGMAGQVFREGRIDGITPAALTLLVAHVRRGRGKRPKSPAKSA